MKKRYTELELEVVRFDGDILLDVVEVSGGGDAGNIPEDD